MPLMTVLCLSAGAPVGSVDMAPVTISIPCASHRACTFHKHGAGKFNDLSRSHTTYDGTQETGKSVVSTPTDVPRPEEHNITRTKLSRFERLPQELFLIVVASLDLQDKACLALASRAMTYALGSDIWATARTWKPNELNGFLAVLARDLSEQYWHCEECVVLHRQCAIKEVAPTGLLGMLNGFKSLWRPQLQVLEERSFHIQVRGTPIYILSFPAAQAVMDHHFQGKDQGRCIDTLQCSGRFKYPYLNEIGNMVLKYRVEPKIVLDRLLLRATYTWEVEDWKERLGMPNDQRPNIQGARIDPEVLINNMDLFVCEHMSAITALRAASHRPLTREPLRCQYCPAQFWVRYTTGSMMEFSTEFQVWHNLGPCRNPEEERWTYMVSSRDEQNEYEWQKWRKGKKEYADEDAREAYEWVPFKTVKIYEERFGKVGQYPWDSYFYPERGNRDSPRGHRLLRRSVAETLL